MRKVYEEEARDKDQYLHVVAHAPDELLQEHERYLPIIYTRQVGVFRASYDTPRITETVWTHEPYTFQRDAEIIRKAIELFDTRLECMRAESLPL